MPDPYRNDEATAVEYLRTVLRENSRLRRRGLQLEAQRRGVITRRVYPWLLIGGALGCSATLAVIHERARPATSAPAPLLLQPTDASSAPERPALLAPRLPPKPPWETTLGCVPGKAVESSRCQAACAPRKS